MKRWLPLLAAMVLIIAITTLHGQVDVRTRAWVLNTLKDIDGVIDTVYFHYTDSLSVPILIVTNYAVIESLNVDTIIVNNWMDSDSINTDHMVVNVHLYADSIAAQHVAFDSAVIDVFITADSANFDDMYADTATVDSLDAQHVVADVHVKTDSIQANHIVLVGNALLWSTYRDTATGVWNDSSAAIADSFSIDTLTCDTIKTRALYITDSLTIPQMSALPASGTSGLFAADTANDSVIAFVGGTRAVLYPSSGGIAASAVRDTINAWWGDTSAALADSFGIDTLTSDTVKTRALYISDSLTIPQYNGAPANGSAGIFGADSANDTLVAFIGGTRAIVYPASGSGISAAAVGDTANAVRGEIRDTATVVWNDSLSAVLSYAGDTADVVRGEIRDTATVVWNDSLSAVLSYVGDTAAVVRGEIRDTATVVWNDSLSAVLSYVGDTATVVRAEIPDTAALYAGDSVAQVRSEIPDTAALYAGDSTAQARAEMRDTATTVFNDSIAVVKVPRTIVWYYDGDVATATQFGATYIPEEALTVNDIKLHVETAPVGASLIVDINEAGSTIFSTNPEIDAAATREDDNHAISDNSIAAGAEVTLDIDQVGSSTAGASLTVILECEQVTTR